MEESISYKALITKTKDLSLGKYTQINEGQQFNAFFTKWLVLGENFIFYYKSKFIFFPITTTTVLEIIDEKTFRTKNSIYTIYTIEQQREDKIEIILK